jgi:arginase family enzyme
MPTTRTVTALCGLPRTDFNNVPVGSIGAVLGAAYSLGSPHDGAENAPFFLRTVSKKLTWAAQDPALFDLRHEINPLQGFVDLGDLDFDGMALEDALAATESAVRSLPATVAPCVIGGDHTVSLAVVKALLRRRKKPLCVVQFDHHLDLQIWDGAPAKISAEREPIFHTNVMSHVSDLIGPGNLIQVGVSPYVTVEGDAVDALPKFLRTIGRQICFSSPAIDDNDAFQSIVGGGKDIYISVDIDVIDKIEMRSTSYPAEVGLSVQQLLRLIDWAAARNKLVGFDVVEFAAARDDRSPQTIADSERALLIFLHLVSCLAAQSAAHAPA